MDKKWINVHCFMAKSQIVAKGSCFQFDDDHWRVIV